jgi:hypothetical protein
MVESVLKDRVQGFKWARGLVTRNLNLGFLNARILGPSLVQYCELDSCRKMLRKGSFALDKEIDMGY